MIELLSSVDLVDKQDAELGHCLVAAAKIAIGPCHGSRLESVSLG